MGYISHGSTKVASLLEKDISCDSWMAQLVRLLALNNRVASAIPAWDGRL